MDSFRELCDPGVIWRGTLPAGKIVKLRQEQEVVDKRP